jgi:succinate dehydrogenase hydrophobic anchor subunit
MPIIPKILLCLQRELQYIPSPISEETMTLSARLQQRHLLIFLLILLAAILQHFGSGMEQYIN